MKLINRISLFLLCCLVLSGCAQYENRRGVDVAWQSSALAQLKAGETTRSEVLDLLGPPSQVIALEDGSILYYLFERSDGEGLILILYNRFEIDTRYDRAIFFFDDDDVLTEYSVRSNDGEDD